jgi:hypothetical protein
MSSGFAAARPGSQIRLDLPNLTGSSLLPDLAIRQDLMSFQKLIRSKPATPSAPFAEAKASA